MLDQLHFKFESFLLVSGFLFCVFGAVINVIGWLGEGQVELSSFNLFYLDCILICLIISTAYCYEYSAINYMHLSLVFALYLFYACLFLYCRWMRICLSGDMHWLQVFLPLTRESDGCYLFEF